MEFNLTNETKELAVLLDPDWLQGQELDLLGNKVANSGVSSIFVGGSLVDGNDVHTCVQDVKSICNLPVIIFPGSGMQLSPLADGILFLSLLSGRNPEFLIGQQVLSAPYIKKVGLKTFATGYVLIDGGKETTASYVSNSKPIPADKPQIAVATAIAAEMLGFEYLYLDCGSGAKSPVPVAMIEAVRKAVKMPIIVGGGIKTKQQIQEAYGAGANLVVVGTAFENDNNFFNDLK